MDPLVPLCGGWASHESKDRHGLPGSPMTMTQPESTRGLREGRGRLRPARPPTAAPTPLSPPRREPRSP